MEIKIFLIVFFVLCIVVLIFSGLMIQLHNETRFKKKEMKKKRKQSDAQSVAYKQEPKICSYCQAKLYARDERCPYCNAKKQ